MIIRNERSADHAAIRRIVTEAFATVPYSRQTEAAIVDALRAAGDMTLSLVAEDGDPVGHVVFSPAIVGDGRAEGWYGVGPLAVRPDRQGRGIGTALVRAGLDRLKAAAGCVLVGDPAFYGRFGFRTDPGLTLPGVPPEVLLALPLAGKFPAGTVRFHPAFGVEA